MKLGYDFYQRDVLKVAPELLGKILVRKYDDESVSEFVIGEVEAYVGEEDLACHASKGRTKRTEIMYADGGFVYVYLVYGMYWLLNVVTGKKDSPQAVLIRSVTSMQGPGRVGKVLQLDKSFYGEDLTKSSRIWLKEGILVDYEAKPRVGVHYAGTWANKPWRFVVSKPTSHAQSFK